VIVVKVELHSAITGKATPLGTMVIANLGTGTKDVGNYEAGLITKDGRKGRRAQVHGHRRLALSIWVLVAKCIRALYDQAPELDPDAKEGELDFIAGRVS
jgi:hypothetical protein